MPVLYFPFPYSFLLPFSCLEGKKSYILSLAVAMPGSRQTFSFLSLGKIAYILSLSLYFSFLFPFSPQVQTSGTFCLWHSKNACKTVSYTHLTLPTILRV